MIDKKTYIYQQIVFTTAEWAVNNTVYPASVWLFERLENGKFNMKLSDGVHTFNELETVFLDVKVAANKGLYLNENGELELVEEFQERVKKAIVPTDVLSVTTLSDLPFTHYNIKYEYTENDPQVISFNGDMIAPEGFECVLSILNGTDQDIEQPLPDGENWQVEGSTITLPAGKMARIHISSIFGKFVVEICSSNLSEEGPKPLATLEEALKYAIVIPDRYYTWAQAVNNVDANGNQIYPEDYRLLTYEEMQQLESECSYSWEDSSKYGVLTLPEKYGLKQNFRAYSSGYMSPLGRRGEFVNYWCSDYYDSTYAYRLFADHTKAIVSFVTKNDRFAILAIPKYKTTSLIPSGYHVPSQTEWQSLIEATNSTWNATNTERIFTNKTGGSEVCRLNAQGVLTDGITPGYRGVEGLYMSTTEVSSNTLQNYELFFTYVNMSVRGNWKVNAESIRLIPNNATDMIDGMSRSVELMQQYTFNEITA